MDRYRTVGAVIAAAGSSSRMGGRDKLAEPLDGIPVILRTLAAVEAVPEIREIVVVTREDRVEEYRRLLGQCSRLRAVVPAAAPGRSRCGTASGHFCRTAHWQPSMTAPSAGDTGGLCPVH